VNPFTQFGGTPWMRDRSIARTIQHRITRTYIHASNGIRIYGPIARVVQVHKRLRLRGHWIRSISCDIDKNGRKTKKLIGWVIRRLEGVLSLGMLSLWRCVLHWPWSTCKYIAATFARVYVPCHVNTAVQFQISRTFRSIRPFCCTK
jgi:hypothetical protein